MLFYKGKQNFIKILRNINDTVNFKEYQRCSERQLFNTFIVSNGLVYHSIDCCEYKE